MENLFCGTHHNSVAAARKQLSQTQLNQQLSCYFKQMLNTSAFVKRYGLAQGCYYNALVFISALNELASGSVTNVEMRLVVSLMLKDVSSR